MDVVAAWKRIEHELGAAREQIGHVHGFDYAYLLGRIDALKFALKMLDEAGDEGGDAGC